MAIQKHKTPKNMSYDDVLDYYECKHKESDITRFYAPILGENGLIQKRGNFAACFLDGAGREHDPEDWARACTETLVQFRIFDRVRERCIPLCVNGRNLRQDMARDNMAKAQRVLQCLCNRMCVEDGIIKASPKLYSASGRLLP